MAKKPAKKEKAVKAPKAETESRVLTQEDIESNPELAEQGLVAGDTVEIPVEEPDASAPAVKEKPSKGGFSIVANGEYIRTYANKETAEEFVAKDSSGVRKIVPEVSIQAVVVEYDFKDSVTGVVSRKAKIFTARDNGANFKELAIVMKNDKLGVCLVK